MELIKKSIIALSAESNTKNYNNGEDIFYSIQYTNQFVEYHESEQLNFIPSKDKVNHSSISLKQIKEIIPRYKFCCCYSKTCICNFIVRYKSRDNSGIYPWIWCDLVTDQDIAIPYNSNIVLKILVFLKCSSVSDEYFHVELTDSECYKNIGNDFENFGYDETKSMNDHPYNSKFQKIGFQISNSSNFKDLINHPRIVSTGNHRLAEENNREDTYTLQSTLELTSKVAAEERSNFCYDNLVEEIGKWSRKHDGSYKDIRVLLSSLHQVLWENAQWEPIEFSKLMSDIELVKKVYRKAIVLCHPDKHHKESEEHKSRVHLIFTAVNEAHNKYNSF